MEGVVTPGDGSLERLVSRSCGTSATCQEPKAVGQHFLDLTDRECSNAGSCQLASERDTVKSDTNSGQLFNGLSGERKRRVRLFGSLNEQGDCIELRSLRHRRQAALRGGQ